MFAEFGYGVLVVTFLVALYSVIAAIYGATKNPLHWWKARAAPCCSPSR